MIVAKYFFNYFSHFFVFGLVIENKSLKGTLKYLQKFFGLYANIT